MSGISRRSDEMIPVPAEAAKNIKNAVGKIKLLLTQQPAFTAGCVPKTYMSHEFGDFACEASPNSLQFTGQLADV